MPSPRYRARTWGSGEIAILREHDGKATLQELAKLVERTVEATSRACYRFGVSPRPVGAKWKTQPWTTDELAILGTHGIGKSGKDLHTMIPNHTPGAIRTKRILLGIRRGAVGNRLISFGEQTMSAAEWVVALGVSKDTIRRMHLQAANPELFEVSRAKTRAMVKERKQARVEQALADLTDEDRNYLQEIFSDDSN